MKYFACIVSTAIILLLSACRKETFKGNATLSGQWKLIQTLADPGDGSGTWQPAQNVTTTVQFNSDGTLGGTAFPIYNKYAVKDSVTLVFTQPDNTIQNFRYSIHHDSLTMSPDGPIRCYEACGERFKKVE